jgi:3-oxoacyl-(acyl-carrier-protein) synthase
VLVLEEYEHAVARGARILAEYVGGAVTCDAHHMTEPQPEGKGTWRGGGRGECAEGGGGGWGGGRGGIRGGRRGNEGTYSGRVRTHPPPPQPHSAPPTHTPPPPPPPLARGAGVIMCLERALAAAGVAATDVTYVNAHATSTPAGDMAEYRALRKVFAHKARPGGGRGEGVHLDAVPRVLGQRVVPRTKCCLGQSLPI